MNNTLLRRGLKISHLRMIAAFADTGQIGQAAQSLGITQPAASRLMSEIERIVGQAVHERTGRGVALTTEGHALASRARRIMIEIADADREISELITGTSGHVKIGSVTGPAIELVLPAVRAARVSFPQVTVEVDVANSDVLGDQLADGGIDFSLARLPNGIDPNQFTFSALGTEPVSLIARREHRLAHQNNITPLDLMEFDWVMPAKDTILRKTVDTRIHALKLPSPTVKFETSSFLLTLAMITQSNTIAPLATAVVRQFTSGPNAPFVRVPIDFGTEVETFGILERKGSRLTPAAERIKSLITAAATEQNRPA